MKNHILLPYLLSIEELLTEGSVLLEKAFRRVDDGRREKAAAMRPGRGQAASLGAGLLLQLALGEMSGIYGVCSQDRTGLELPREDRGVAYEGGRYTVSRLLTRLESMPRFPAGFRYGEKGKPYFTDYPFYFSLSHSGDYVLCVISRREIGADIQQWGKCQTRRIAERFFSDREREALEQIRRTEGSDRESWLFFRLWARKEAYGKLTGRGIGDAAEVNLLPGEETWPEGRELLWMESEDFPGYSMAVCRYA